MPASSLIYLDHNATTPVVPEAQAAMERAQREAWANPGSRHRAGRRARQVLEEAREQVATILGAKPAEVIFTSGGTESNNLALMGLFDRSRPGVAVLPGEHPSVEEPVQRLVARGARRVPLPITANGGLDTSELDRLPWNEIGLVAVVLAHSETGVIRDVSRLRELADEHRTPWHLDAVQAVGKISVDFGRFGATTLSLAAHKFGGPRGVGVLLLRQNARLTPLMAGGLQEGERRPGTESAPLAAGMAAALGAWQRDQAERTARLGQLRQKFETALLERCAPAIVHGGNAERLPNTVNIAFPGCESDSLLVALDLAGIACSIGTACASGSTEPAPILVAMGCPVEVQKSSVRFSLGWNTTEEHIREAVERIASTVGSLRR